MDRTRLVIICTQNSARSQMAEAFFKKYGDDVLEVHSAGFEPQEVNPLAKQVMAEVGIDISSQRSKSVKEFLGRMQFGYVVSVCKKAEGRCPTIFPGVRKLLSWPFDDPAAFEGTDEKKLDKFREVRDEIEIKVREFVNDYQKGLC